MSNNNIKTNKNDFRAFVECLTFTKNHVKLQQFGAS